LTGESQIYSNKKKSFSEIATFLKEQSLKVT